MHGRTGSTLAVGVNKNHLGFFPDSTKQEGCRGQLRKTTSNRVLDRLHEAGLTIPDGSRLFPTRLAAWRRAQGAWTWTGEAPNGEPLNIGSHERMTDLLKQPVWHLSFEFGEVTVASCSEVCTIRKGEKEQCVDFRVKNDD
jgi:hypothetical protein